MSLPRTPKTQVLVRCCVPQRPRFVRVLVIGAGGTGARVIPPLVKLLPPGRSCVALCDDDHVEPRNLLRQDFYQEDVGCYKAEVIAERYTSQAVPVLPVITRWDGLMPLVHSDSDNEEYPTILGCVDNVQTRIMMRDTRFSVYLDAGNALRTGQVVLSLYRRRTAITILTPHTKGTVEGNLTCQGTEMCPAPWDTEQQEAPAAPACGFRFDDQTVAANQLAASCMITMLGWCLHGHQMGFGGLQFSTLGGVTGIPWPKTLCWDFRAEAGVLQQNTRSGYTVVPHTSQRFWTRPSARQIMNTYVTAQPVDTGEEEELPEGQFEEVDLEENLHEQHQ